MKYLPIVLLLGTVLLAAPAIAEQGGTADSQREILLQKIKADKKLLVSMNMDDLTDEEAKAFWPVYDDYQKDLEKLNQRLGKAIMEYAQALNKGPLADDVAKRLLGEALAIDEAELKLKQTTAEKLGNMMPMRKVARYIQIETKIRAIIKAELAREIPLAY